MDNVLRLLIPVVVVAVIAVLWWAGKAVAEGAKEGLDDAKAEQKVARAERAREQASAQVEREARIETAAAQLTAADRLALGLRAPFTEIWLDLFAQPEDGRALDLFYRLTPPAGQEEQLRKSLADGWDVSDHASATEKIAWLLNTGHRTNYTRVRRALANGEPQLNKRLADVVRRWEGQVGEAGGAAFDFSRAVDVAAQAHALGYLSEQEAWRVLRHCAALAQDTFSSWEAFGHSFLAGAQFWKSGGLLGAQMHKRYAQAVTWLLEHPDSPWRRDTWPGGQQPLDARH